MLDMEYQYYKAHEAEFVRDHKDKFLGIVGQEVVGVFDTELEAYTSLKKAYGLGRFLLQQAIPVQQDRIQRYHSRVALH